MISVGEIAERLNAEAASLAPDLLPNGRRAGTKWMFSGIADTGQSESAWVHLSGSRIGHWCDAGNCAAGEERGDMIDLLRLRLGLDAAQAVREAKRRLGIEDSFAGPAVRADPAAMERRAAEARARAAARQAEEDAERAVKIRRAMGLYRAAEPLAGTPGEAYLAGRAIALAPGQAWPGSVRFHGEVWHRDERCKLPAMVSAIYRADGRHIGTHRIYLQRASQGWTKLASPAAKMVLGTMWGGFVPIAKGASGKPMSKMPEGEPVYVTEGIEDALVVRMMKPAARIVAAISLGNMGAIVLPPNAGELVLVCDRDSKPRAQEQLERSIAQQQARGLRVRLVMPPESHAGIPVKDVNDWWQAILRARQGAGRAAAQPPLWVLRRCCVPCGGAGARQNGLTVADLTTAEPGSGCDGPEAEVTSGAATGGGDIPANSGQSPQPPAARPHCAAPAARIDLRNAPSGMELAAAAWKRT